MTATRLWLAVALVAGFAAARPGSAAEDPTNSSEGPSSGTSLPGPSQQDIAPSPDLVSQGKDLYTQLCSHCHGIRMVNPGNSSFDLRKFPHADRARFFNSVTHGKNTMPAWGDMLKPDEIEALWAYVRTGGKT
jgi:mono/diheme cytochrome c family protein